MDIVPRTPQMTREEFFTRAETREQKYEFDGFQWVAMTQPNIDHARIAGNRLAALRSRIRSVPCRAYTDAGIAAVGDAVRCPDAVVSCPTTWTTTTLVSGGTLELRQPSHSIPVGELYEEVDFPGTAVA